MEKTLSGWMENQRATEPYVSLADELDDVGVTPFGPIKVRLLESCVVYDLTCRVSYILGKGATRFLSENLDQRIPAIFVLLMVLAFASTFGGYISAITPTEGVFAFIIPAFFAWLVCGPAAEKLKDFCCEYPVWERISIHHQQEIVRYVDQKDNIFNFVIPAGGRDVMRRIHDFDSSIRFDLRVCANDPFIEAVRKNKDGIEERETVYHFT